MSLANNIRYLRKKQGWSQDELAEKLGYKSYTTVQKWESGVSEPPLKKAHALADLFHVDIDAMTKGELWMEDVPMERAAPPAKPDIPPGFEPLPPMVKLPLVGAIACGQPITAEENLEGAVSVPEEWNADFVLTCRGDSMAPKIEDGDLVAIRIQPEVANGQIAAVRIDSEATLKKVYRYSDRLELRPINPDFESIVLYGEDINTAAIEGLAVGLCRGI